MGRNCRRLRGLPAIAVQPWGGVLIDRVSRTRALAIGNALALMQAALLAVLYAAGLLRLGVVVIIAVALGVIEGINQPARLTVIAEFADKDRLRTAITLNSFAFNLARFVGPLLAGALLTQTSPAHAFAFNATSYLPMTLPLTLAPRLQSVRQSDSMRAAFVSGLRVIRHHPIIFDLLSLAVIVNLSCRSLIELLPAISGYWYQNDPVILSMLTTSVAVGAILGGLLILTRLSCAMSMGFVP